MTSSRLRTTGKRRVGAARVTFSSHGTSIANTWRYRNRSACSAWFWVDALTLRSDRQIGQELLNLGCAELAGVAALVESDISPNPLQVGLLRPVGQVARAHLFARYFQQSSSLRHVAFVSGHLGDISTRPQQWKQRVAFQSIHLSDVFGVFDHPISVLYI